MNDTQTGENTLPANRPATVVLLAAVVALEAIVVGGTAVFVVAETAASGATFIASSLALAGMAVIGAVFLAVLAVATWRLRPWVRGAAITWQVLQLAVAWVFLQGDIANWVGFALAAMSVVGIIAAVHPATGRVLRRET